MKKNKGTLILGLETSCDETAASVIEITDNSLNYKLKQMTNIRILSNIIYSQVKIHAKYKGIVPEIAARKQAENILPVIKKALQQAKIKKPNKEIDALAVTVGPGLITSLIVGVEAAKTLSWLWQKPLVPVDHLMAHLYVNFVNNQQLITNNQQLFPAIGLIASGGHTELILINGFEKFKKIGQTRDDAAGECFDKAARILGLGYPGGPAIAAGAVKIQNLKSEARNKSRITNSKFQINLPRPMIKTDDFDFSFSGLKTAVLYKVKNYGLRVKRFIPEFCTEIQQAVIDVLMTKTWRAVRKFKVRTIILGGGVVANNELRKQFNEKLKMENRKFNFLVPPKNLCGDNALMVAMASYFKLKKTPKKDWLKKFDWRKIKVDPVRSLSFIHQNLN